MKITKYPQSNFLIENEGKKILIDPGNFTFEKYSVDDFPSLDAILITHQHADHLDKGNVKKFIEKGVPLYGNHDVASLFNDPDFEITKVEHEKEFEIAGFKIKPIELPHCKMLDGSDGPPNTGFLINDLFFHPGDGIELKGLRVENASIPIVGPTIDYNRAWDLALSLQVKKIVPMHYSNPTFKADPHEFAKGNPGNTEVVILENSASIEIT